MRSQENIYCNDTFYCCFVISILLYYKYSKSTNKGKELTMVQISRPDCFRSECPAAGHVFQCAARKDCPAREMVELENWIATEKEKESRGEE